MRELRSAFLTLLLVAIHSCRTTNGTPYAGVPGSRYLRDGNHYAIAVYDELGQLRTAPLDAMRSRFEQAYKHGEPYTDLYVVAHGWDFSHTESIANYNAWMEAFDAKFSLTRSPDFRPFILFVSWDSISRPFHDLFTSFGFLELDALLVPLADAQLGLDFPFHIASAWGESMRAYNVALGRDQYTRYRTESYDTIMTGSPNTMDMGPESKADLPLSVLLRSIMALRSTCGDFRIHGIGHSYGAKVIAFAAAEALFSGFTWERHRYPIKGPRPSRFAPLDSLVLFNVAFGPDELDSMPGATRALCEMTDRLAFVYSNTDYAAGTMFTLSELILNRGMLQDSTQIFRLVRDEYATQYVGRDDVFGFLPWETVESTTAAQVLDWAWYGAWQTAASIAHVGVSLVRSPLHWGSTKIRALPGDWYYHTFEHDPFGSSNWWIPLNAIDYYLPVSVLFKGLSTEDFGFWRHTAPAFGRTGVHSIVKGRDTTLARRSVWLDNLAPYVHPHECGAETELDMLGFIEKGDFDCIRTTNSVISINASEAYNSWAGFQGSHGDLRSTDPVNGDDESSPTKRDVTLDFLLKWTLPRNVHERIVE